MNFERKVLPTYTSNYAVLDQSPMRSDYLTIKRSRRSNKERIRSPNVLTLQQYESSRCAGKRRGSKQRKPAVSASESEILVEDVPRHKCEGVSEAALLLQSTLHGRSFNHMREDFNTGKSLLTHGVSLLHERDKIMETKYQALLKDDQAHVSLQDSESNILNKNKSNYLVSAHTGTPVNICRSDTLFERECGSWDKKTELSGLRRQLSPHKNQPPSPDCSQHVIFETAGGNRRSYIDRARNMFAISKIIKDHVKFPDKCSGQSKLWARTTEHGKSEAAEPDHEMYASYIGDHCRRNRRSKSIDRRVDIVLQRELDCDRSIHFLDLNAQSEHGRKVTRKLFSPDTGDPSHRYITKRYGHRIGNDETHLSQNFAESNFNSNLTREKLLGKKADKPEGKVGIDNRGKWQAWEYASYDSQDKCEQDGQSCYGDEQTRKIDSQSRYNELARKPDGQINYKDELTWNPNDSPVSYKDELTLKPDGQSNYKDDLTRKQDVKMSLNKRRPRKRRLRSAPKQTLCSSQRPRRRYPSGQQEDMPLSHSGIQSGEKCLIRPSHCSRQGRPSTLISPASIFDYDDLKKPPWTCAKWRGEAPKDSAEEMSPSKWTFETYSDTCITAPDKYASSNDARVREDLVNSDAVAAHFQSRDNENQTSDIYGISDRISSRLPDSPKLMSDYAADFTAMQKMRMPLLLLGYQKTPSFDNDAKISSCAKDKWTCCIESNIRHRNNKVMDDSTRYSGNGELGFHAKPMFSPDRKTRTSHRSQKAEICERAEIGFKARTKDRTAKSESAANSKQKSRGEFETKNKHRKSSPNEHTNAASCRVQSKSVTNSSQPKGNVNSKFTTREYANTEDIQGTFENMNSLGMKGEKTDKNMTLMEGVEKMLDKSRLGKVGTVTKVNCATDVVKKALRKLVAFQRTFAADMKENDHEEEETEALSYETYVKGRNEQSANEVDSDVDFEIKVHTPCNPKILAMYGHQNDADTQDAELHDDPILKLQAAVATEKCPLSNTEDATLRASRPDRSTNKKKVKNEPLPPPFGEEEHDDSSNDSSDESCESDPPFLTPDKMSVVSCSEMSSTEVLSIKPTVKEIFQDELINFLNPSGNDWGFTSTKCRRKKSNRSRKSLEDSINTNSETSCSPYHGIGKIKKKLSRTKLLRRKKKLSSRSRSRIRRGGKKGRKSPIIDNELSVIEAIRASYRDQLGENLTGSSEKLSKRSRRKSSMRQRTPRIDNTNNLERSLKPTVLQSADSSHILHIQKDPTPPRSAHKSFMRSVSPRRAVRVRHSSKERKNSKSELRRRSTSSSERHHVRRKRSTEKVGKFRVRDEYDDRTESKSRKKRTSAEYKNHTTDYYKSHDQIVDNKSKRGSMNSGVKSSFRNMGDQGPTLLVPGSGVRPRNRWTEDKQKHRNAAERGKNNSLSPTRIESSTSRPSSSETSIFRDPALQQSDTKESRFKYYENLPRQQRKMPEFEAGRELNIIHSCKSENKRRASVYNRSLKSEIASSVTTESAQSSSETSMAENQATTSTFSGKDVEHGPGEPLPKSGQEKVELSEKPAANENVPKTDFNTTQLNISIMKLYEEINKLRKQLEASTDEINTRPTPVIGHDPPILVSKPKISPRAARLQSCTSSASSCCWKDSYQSHNTSKACTPVIASTDSQSMQYYERLSEASGVKDVPAKGNAYTEKVEWSNVDGHGCQFNSYMKKYGLGEPTSVYFSEKENAETAPYADNETSGSKHGDRYFDKSSRYACSDKREPPLRDAKYWPNDTIYVNMTPEPLQDDDTDAPLESTEKSNNLESADSARQPSAESVLEHLPANIAQTAPDAENLYTSEPFASKRAAHQLMMMSCSDTVKQAILAASQELTLSDRTERPSSQSSTHDSDLPESEASTNKQKPASTRWLVRSVESFEQSTRDSHSSTRDSISSTIDKESYNTNAHTLYPGSSRKQPKTEQYKICPKGKETSLCFAGGLNLNKEAWVGNSMCERSEKEYLHLDELNQSQNQGSSYEESHVPENVSFNIATSQMWCQERKCQNDSVSEDHVPGIIKCVRDILFGSTKAQAKDTASGSHQKHECPARSPARRKHSKSPAARSSGLRPEVIESQLDEICANGYVRGYKEERASSKRETSYFEIAGPPDMCTYITKKRGNTEVPKPRNSLNNVQNSPKRTVFIDNEEPDEKSPFYGEAVLTTGRKSSSSSMREDDLMLTSQSSPRQLSGVRAYPSIPHSPAPKQVEETDKSIHHYSDAISSKTRANSPALEVSRSYSAKSVSSGSERSFPSSYIDEKAGFKMYEGVRKHVRREKSPNPGTGDQSVYSGHWKPFRDYDHFSRREYFLPNVPKLAPPKEENAMIESFESMMQQRRPCYVEQCGFRQKKNKTPSERRTFGELNEGGVNSKQGETCNSDLPGVSFTVNNSSSSETKRTQSNSKMYKHTNAESREFDDCTNNTAFPAKSESKDRNTLESNKFELPEEADCCQSPESFDKEALRECHKMESLKEVKENIPKSLDKGSVQVVDDDEEVYEEDEEEDEKSDVDEVERDLENSCRCEVSNGNTSVDEDERESWYNTTDDESDRWRNGDEEADEIKN